MTSMALLQLSIQIAHVGRKLFLRASLSAGPAGKSRGISRGKAVFIALKSPGEHTLAVRPEIR